MNHGTGPDLLMLDVYDPGPEGYAFCGELKSLITSREMPVIFLTSGESLEDGELVVELGVVAHISLPLNVKLFQSRVRSAISVANNATALRINNEYLEREIQKRTRQLTVMQDTTIMALASLAETRDLDTGNHLRRTQHYVKVLAEYLQANPLYTDYLSDTTIDLMFKCAPLHDIGKVGIPDRILLKPGRYEAAEFEIMKKHPQLGRDAILHAQQADEDSMEFFEVAKAVVYSHHEKWDGSGYPLGLSGDDIPVPGRLMALADVYDALISTRVYKAGMSHADAAAIICKGRGQHFDPHVVDAFLHLASDFRAIAARYADSESDLTLKADSIYSTLHTAHPLTESSSL